MSFSVFEDGPRVKITAECPDDHTGLYKAYLVGSGGRVLMGTLAPEQGKLRITRTFSVDSLHRQGVWPLETVDIVLSYAAPVSLGDIPDGWSLIENLSSLMEDPVLKQSSAAIRSALVRRWRDGFLVALPFGGTFGLTPLFCLCVVESIAGKHYAVFSFNEKGIPTAPHKTK